MTLDELTEKQKSFMLAQAMGWYVKSLPHKTVFAHTIVDADGNDVGLAALGGGVEPRQIDLRPHRLMNLYAPENMPVAWRVLNWAYKENLERFSELIRTDLLWYLYELPPEQAQRAWLDKILKLAIEQGLARPDVAPAEA